MTFLKWLRTYFKIWILRRIAKNSKNLNFNKYIIKRNNESMLGDFFCIIYFLHRADVSNGRPGRLRGLLAFAHLFC